MLGWRASHAILLSSFYQGYVRRVSPRHSLPATLKPSSQLSECCCSLILSSLWTLLGQLSPPSFFLMFLTCSVMKLLRYVLLLVNSSLICFSSKIFSFHFRFLLPSSSFSCVLSSNFSLLSLCKLR